MYRFEKQEDPAPKLVEVYCELVSHKTEVIDNAYEVPAHVKLVKLQVFPYTEEEVWRSLNRYGFYSKDYRLVSYWRPDYNEPF
jgi:hypothetical protein